MGMVPHTGWHTCRDQVLQYELIFACTCQNSYAPENPYPARLEQVTPKNLSRAARRVGSRL